MNLHPITAGIINAIAPGLSYVMLKERIVFGWLMFAGSLLFAIVLFADPSPAFDTFFFAVTPLGKTVEGVSYVLITLAFAYDAYALARAKRAALLPVAQA